MEGDIGKDYLGGFTRESLDDISKSIFESKEKADKEKKSLTESELQRRKQNIFRENMRKFGQRREKQILVVTAHPDDESMFFTPTLFNLTNQHNVFLLCLSCGDYEKLGETRKKELLKCCTYLSISKAEIVDHKELQDGPQNNWNPALISELVEKFVKENNITEVQGLIHKIHFNFSSKIITFDEWGISGHPNHIAVFQGVK